MKSFVALLFVCPMVAQPIPSDRPVAFTMVNVIPMDRERILPHQTVVVRGGRITEMGPSRDLKPPADAIVIPGQGRYLMPGLADMHVHLDESDLPLFLANGVTTVRNLNGGPEHIALRNEIRKGTRLGPDIFTSGPLTAGTPLRFRLKSILTTPEEAERAVREQKAAGFDFVKAYDGLTMPSYQALVRTARELGMPVVGHIPEDAGFDAALRNQASIEHVEQLVYRVFSSDLDPLAIDPVAKKIANARVAVCPTVAVLEAFASGPAFMQKAENRFAGKETLDWWKQSVRSNTAFAEMMIWFSRKIVRGLQDAGVTILAGTDTPNPGMVPGYSLHDELRALTRSGLTPFEALAAATRDAGRFLNADFGVVAPGKRADLLLIDSNPFLDISNAAKIQGVMIRGRWIPKDQLERMLPAVQ